MIVLELRSKGTGHSDLFSVCVERAEEFECRSLADLN